MEFICYNCHHKLSDARLAANKEICQRLDNGEKLIDVFIEYANEARRLLNDGKSDTERYYFAEAAVGICEGVLASRVVENAGWTRNYSLFWVKKVPGRQED